MPTKGASMEFLESVLDKVEEDPRIQRFSEPKEIPDSEESKMQEKIKKKLRVYRELYFDILD